MAHFVGSDDNAAESAGIFDDGDRIDFFETLVHDTRSANVRESCGVGSFCSSICIVGITCIEIQSN